MPPTPDPFLLTEVCEFLVDHLERKTPPAEIGPIIRKRLKTIKPIADARAAREAAKARRMQSRIQNWLSGAVPIPNAMARQIEQRLNLPVGWMDSEHNVPLRVRRRRPGAHAHHPPARRR